MKRVTLGEPIPGLDQGRPIPAKPGESQARQALRRAWLARFTVDGDRLHPEGLEVLRDLARFCDGVTTTARMDGEARADPLAMALAEGRRQALLFVLGRLGLAPLDVLLSINDQG